MEAAQSCRQHRVQAIQREKGGGVRFQAAFRIYPPLYVFFYLSATALQSSRCRDLFLSVDINHIDHSSST